MYLAQLFSKGTGDSDGTGMLSECEAREQLEFLSSSLFDHTDDLQPCRSADGWESLATVPSSNGLDAPMEQSPPLPDLGGGVVQAGADLPSKEAPGAVVLASGHPGL